MFMMIKCRPRLVRDSAKCRQSEVLSQVYGQNPTGQNPTLTKPTGQNPTGQNPTHNRYKTPLNS